MSRKRIVIAAMAVILDLLIWFFTEPNIILFVLFNAFFVLLLVKADTFFEMPMELIRNKGILFNLAKNDFKTRFAGSYFGIFWAFVQPVVTIILYWFVFSVGLKAGRAGGGQYPFVLWLIAGLVPWFLFSEALTNGTNALIEYTYLVKKVVFQISVLPAVKVISASFIHFFFIIVMLIIYTCMGYYPTLYTLQIIYYLICMWALVISLVYATSAIVLFFRDLGQIINIFMQVFMWMTPIMWEETAIPEAVRWIFKLNPMYYVITGYRDALLSHVWVYEHINMTMYFWIAVGILFLVGTTIFKRLKPHFADVL